MKINENRKSEQQTNINKKHSDKSFQSYIPLIQYSHLRKKTLERRLANS